MARPIQVAIDCEDPDRLAAFWAEVLGYRVSAPPSGYTSWSEYSRAVAGEPNERWSLLVDPDGVGPSVLFHRVPEPKVVKNRVHLDVHVTPRTGETTTRPLVDAEARRLVDLGATHVRTDDESDYYAVMQDPEGNEFCVD
jgi:catechol 2,3-dioxygenase-like lactoylglutathione lyase family enzyme